MLRPGDRLGPYRVVARIGGGARADVFRALDVRLGRELALKVLHGADPDDAARALDEARAVAALAHPNVARVFDAGTAEGGAPYVAMEYVDGRPLRAHLGDPRVPVARRVAWLTDVARALAAAHDRGLAHGPLDADDVLVGRDGVVRLVDFGGAAPTTDRAPRGDEADATAQGDDQRAWARLAIELLAPARRDDDALDARPLADDMPSDLAAVIDRARERDAAARFPSMHDVVEALERPPAPTLAAATVAHAEREAHGGGFGAMYWMIALTLFVALALTPARVPPSRGGANEAASRDANPSPPGGANQPPPGGADPSPARAVARPFPAFEVDPAEASSDPEAQTLFAMGMQSLRDGAGWAAMKLFRRAAQRDPTFAAAHLRYVLLQVTPTDALDHLHAAVTFRTKLNERDRLVLDAITPLADDPPNPREMERRLRDAIAAHPNDVELSFALCRQLALREDLEATARACDDTLRLDPTLVAALAWEGTLGRQMGDLGRAFDAWDRCDRLSPIATSCLVGRARLLSTVGRCDEHLEVARRLVALDPDSPDMRTRFADGLAAVGAPAESVRIAIEAAVARTAPDDRHDLDLELNAGLDALGGDFVRSRARALEHDALLAGVAEEAAHEDSASQLIALATETGDRAEVVRVAERFLRARGAWYSRTGNDLSIFGHLALYRAGAIDRAEYDRRRDAWIAADAARPKRLELPLADRWIKGWVLAVTGPDEAREALAELDRHYTLPPSEEWYPEVDEAMGRMFLLVGRVDDALSYLRRAAGSCLAFEQPIHRTRANLLLGQALAAKGDVNGACAAYGAVLARWGHAKPRSVSADEARARAAALHCVPQ